MRTTFFVILSMGLTFLIACKKQGNSEINMNKLYAWCIVPFDAKHRTPQERIEMLKRLGFKKYAYDWRVEHLDEMATEIELARKNAIDIIAVWMWIDANADRVDSLSSANERLLDVLAMTGLKTQLWVSFHPNFFEGLSDDAAVKKGAQMIGYIARRTEALGGNVALYNHGDWFGEPKNQIRIIQSLPEHKLGMVYNFHHAHHQLDEYAENLDRMLPYLWAVNLNGMRKAGPKILPIGQGDLERDMIQALLEKGYNGPFGILGHVEDEDVEAVLKRNLEGLQRLSIQWE